MNVDIYQLKGSLEKNLAHMIKGPNSALSSHQILMWDLWLLQLVLVALATRNITVLYRLLAIVGNYLFYTLVLCFRQGSATPVVPS